jgi:hypothetical protein
MPLTHWIPLPWLHPPKSQALLGKNRKTANSALCIPISQRGHTERTSEPSLHTGTFNTYPHLSEMALNYLTIPGRLSSNPYNAALTLFHSNFY